MAAFSNTAVKKKKPITDIQILSVYDDPKFNQYSISNREKSVEKVILARWREDQKSKSIDNTEDHTKTIRVWINENLLEYVILNDLALAKDCILFLLIVKI